MKCWIVTEGMIGMENQCLGVTDVMKLTPEIKRIGLRQPWKTLCPFLGLERPETFTGDALTAPWPDLALGCGRKSIAALRYIKKASGGKTFTVFIQNPKIGTGAFDLVAIPSHDTRRGPNVLVTPAAPNRLNARKLADGMDDWRPVFGELDAPRVAVLIGGKSQTHNLTAANVDTLARQLRLLADRGRSLMITMSRRTGDANAAALRAALEGSGAWIWDGPGDKAGSNPYFGMLAWADYIIVTSDSVSMISEAATTGKPVYVVPLDGGSKRFDRFYGGLLEKGVIRMFDGNLVNYVYEPLNDAKLIADEIARRMPTLSGTDRPVDQAESMTLN